MNLGGQFIEALESMAANKLRAGLTILGIVIGVAAVISMLAIGRGAQSSITSSITSIGSNLLFVNAGAQNVKNVRPLTTQDVTALSAAPSVQDVAATLQGRETVTAGSQTTNTSVIAVTPNYGTMRNINTTEGQFITSQQYSDRSAVALLGSQVATDLFNRTDNLVGQTIRIGGQPFRVTGVLESKGGGGFGSQDDQIIIPLTTGQSRLFHRGTVTQVDQVLVQAASADKVNSASDEITAILHQRHHLGVKADDFTILKQSDILSTVSTITGTLTLFLGGIGGISLLVGGIGIMNIMLVSVTERTREIGLRKALGAKKWNIRIQFLVESGVLSLIGGIIGILLAWGISTLITRVAANSGTSLTPIIGADAVLLATVFSAAVGLFFGFYPANRAANLEPVEALRAE